MPPFFNPEEPWPGRDGEQHGASQVRCGCGVATRMGFEPTISALTGPYVKPLHHRAVTHPAQACPGNLSLWHPHNDVKGIVRRLQASGDRRTPSLLHRLRRRGDNLVQKGPSQGAELSQMPIDTPGGGGYTSLCCGGRCLPGSLTVE